MIGLSDFFARGPVRARKRIKKHLEGVVASIEERIDVSGYILERVWTLGGLGLSVEGVVSNEFDIIPGYLALYLSFSLPSQNPRSFYIPSHSHSFSRSHNITDPLYPATDQTSTQSQ
jgi:hypothetical protein